MQSNGSTSKRSGAAAGPILAVLGAALVVLSKFLEIGKVSTSGGSVHVKGSSAILVAGVILAVIGVLMWIAKSRVVDKLLGVLAVIAGAFGALIAGVIIGKDPIINSTAKALGVSEAFVKHAVATGRATVTVGLGAWLALAGSILVIVAGIANMVTARKHTSAGPQPESVPAPANAGDFVAR